MDGLDLSDLTEDQLVGLVRACLREVASRDEALVMAAEAAIVDERERHDIALAAAHDEARRLRDAERARIVALARDVARAGLERQMPEVEALRAHAAEAAAAAQLGATMLARRERDEIARRAAADEAAASRARERARVYQETQTRLREEHDREMAAVTAARTDLAAAKARDRAVATLAAEIRTLREAAALVDLPPQGITLSLIPSHKHGRMLIIDEGGVDRYTRDHLVLIGLGEDGPIRTVRRLVARKPDLAAFAARLAAQTPHRLVLQGGDYSWEDAA